MTSSARSRSRFINEHYANQHALVYTVIATYIEVLDLPLVSTFILTEDGVTKHQRTLLPGSIALDWKIDTERITARQLKDAPDLQRAWWALVQNDPISGSTESRLVRLLGSAYFPVAPHKYFRVFRKGGTLHRRAG
jgi:hypothetical protein